MFKNKYLWVIVPHRGVNAGKTRLSSVLNDVARGKLNRWLLERTLRVVAAWLGDAQRVVVVSPCEVTLALARKARAMALPEAHGNAGLNAALAHAASHAAMQGAQRLLILPCDLPRVDAAALQAMTDLPVSARDTVIAPDRHRAGTNALLVDGGAREFAFGNDSYARHLALAQTRGVHSVSFANAALAFDLDTAADFAEWTQSDDVPQEFLATLPRAASRGAGFISSRTK